MRGGIFARLSTVDPGRGSSSTLNSKSSRSPFSLKRSPWHGHDFVFELAGFDRRDGFFMAPHREFVLFGAADFEFLRDVFQR